MAIYVVCIISIVKWRFHGTLIQEKEGMWLGLIISKTHIYLTWFIVRDYRYTINIMPSRNKVPCVNVRENTFFVIVERAKNRNWWLCYI